MSLASADFRYVNNAFLVKQRILVTRRFAIVIGSMLTIFRKGEEPKPVIQEG